MCFPKTSVSIYVFRFRKFFLYWWVGLNHRPDAYKASALTTELHQYSVIKNTELHTETPFGNCLMDTPLIPISYPLYDYWLSVPITSSTLDVCGNKSCFVHGILQSTVTPTVPIPICNRGFTLVVLTHLTRHPVSFREHLCLILKNSTWEKNALLFWWSLRDLNPRPADYESAALTKLS